MHTKTLAAAVVALLFSAPASAAYKCDQGGHVIYSDAPCGNVVGTIRAAPQPGSEDRLRAQADLLRMQQRNRHDREIKEGKVSIGMTAQDVLRSWGEPSKINTTINASGKSEQWVYRRGGFSAQYVYIDNGEVTSVSSN